ncbi:hypothetical protein ACIQOU_21570 [Streptomyces sp. NPDC091279]|uniref:hypothetical protein n=1 Tax=Streptomyces sp. NPDC091279 TaxID=3365983 RepID=UPI00381D560B
MTANEQLPTPLPLIPVPTRPQPEGVPPIPHRGRASLLGGGGTEPGHEDVLDGSRA